MKNGLFYVSICAVAILAGVFSFQGTDVARLAPVEAVWLAQEAQTVCIVTDTGDVGYGRNVQEALQDMKASASGTIFLETADYLIVEQGREELLEQVYEIFRPACQVCVCYEMPQMPDVARFLSTHEPAMTLRQLRIADMPIPLLKDTKGRMELIEQ